MRVTMLSTYATPMQTYVYGDSVDLPDAEAMALMGCNRAIAANTDTDTGITSLTGNITAGPGSGSQVATIATGVVTTAMMGGDVTTAGKSILTAATAAAQRAALGAGGKVYSITAPSTALADTTLTAFSNGTATIGAGIVAGDTLRFHAEAQVDSVDGIDSFRLVVTYAGATVYDSTAIAAALNTNKMVIDGTITIRTAHASTGTAYASGIISGTIGASVLSGLQFVASLSSLNTVAATDLVIKGAFGGAGNTASLQNFVVYHNS